MQKPILPTKRQHKAAIPIKTATPTVIAPAEKNPEQTLVHTFQNSLKAIFPLQMRSIHARTTKQLSNRAYQTNKHHSKAPGTKLITLTFYAYPFTRIAQNAY